MLTYEEILKSLNILLVDDDDDFVDIAEMYLISKGYNVTVCKNGKDAIEEIKTGKYQIMLIDYFMPELTGEDVVNKIRKFNKQLIIILQTGFSGQKPPIETMQKLNIQNYHDKTEGIDSLNLKIISAVKVSSQQNEIAAAKYKTNAIEKIISSIASVLKSNLMSVAASMEVTNLLTSNTDVNLSANDVKILKESYDMNKINLEKIDKILTTLIKGTSESNEDIFSDTEIVEIIKLIVSNDLKEKEIEFISKSSLKNKSYVSGPVADIIFIISELIIRLANISNKDKINFILTEDENNWYFIVESKLVGKLDLNRIIIFKNIAMILKNTTFDIKDNEAKFVISKHVLLIKK